MDMIWNFLKEVMKVNNKQAGNEFEREFCEILAIDGFWSHFMGGNRNGQPADIIAVRNERSYLIDAKDCKHRPVDTGKQIEPPEENGRIDETCPCINADDCWYSFMPEDDYFCADGERKA